MLKKIALSLFLCGAICIVVGCAYVNFNKKEEEKEEKLPPKEEEDTSIRSIDPVCKTEVYKSYSLKLKYVDEIYYFCSQKCENKFLKYPVKYIYKQERKTGQDSRVSRQQDTE
ncbi:MAG: YHS domain-containing protein [bacterium]|nr:YHS domain-containing protein [bacterium]